jgi:hypothetical protein
VAGHAGGRRLRGLPGEGALSFKSLDPDERTTVANPDGGRATRGGGHTLNVISEPGLDRLIFKIKSREQAAKIDIRPANANSPSEAAKALPDDRARLRHLATLR